MAVENNLVCPICGKSFHRKPYTIKIAKWKDGMCCSRDCTNKLRKIKFKGERNHQYGLKGPKNATFITGNRLRKNNKLNEVMIYVGEWHRAAINGRVKEHRYLVEQNHTLFGEEKFDKVGGWYYLKKGFEVHHIDHNHNNNSIDNLIVLTKAEHVRLHNIANPRPRNSKGQFIN
jgi:hypothetical protein